MSTKVPGGSVKNALGRPLPRACSDRGAVPSSPRPAPARGVREDKEAPSGRALPALPRFSLPLALHLSLFSLRTTETLAHSRRAIAGAPSRPRQIAATGSFASSSSTSSPSRASRDAAVSSSSSFYRNHLRRSSSSIPVPSSLPVPHRHRPHTPGELAHITVPFSLSLAR